MGTDMRAHLEYNQTGNYWVSLGSWDLIRNYDMYRLLADGRGEGALYPPRGVPPDVGERARRAYFSPVVETEEEVRRYAGRFDAVSRADAEQAVANGWSEWLHFNDRQFISRPDLHHSSWLTTAEYRRVVDYYVAHQRDFLQRDHREYLAREREALGEEEYQRRLATPNWDTSRTPEQWLHPEFWMLLAAMEAGEARGFRVRLVFWFHG